MQSDVIRKSEMMNEYEEQADEGYMTRECLYINTDIDIGESYYNELESESVLRTTSEISTNIPLRETCTGINNMTRNNSLDNLTHSVQTSDYPTGNLEMSKSILEDKSILESIVHDDDKQVALDKLIKIKKNLIQQNSTEHMNHYTDILSDIENLIIYIKDIQDNKQNLQKQEIDDWIVIGEPTDKEQMNTLISRVSNGYTKLSNLYGSVSQACHTVYNDVEPIFAVTQLAISFYRGGMIGSGILIWSWFSRK